MQYDNPASQAFAADQAAAAALAIGARTLFALAAGFGPVRTATTGMPA